MKTIRDLFLEQKSYIITYDLGNNYYLWIESLSENGNTITSQKFDEKMLENNLIIELHSQKFDESIAEWESYSDFDLDCEIDFLKKSMEYAIQLYESEQ